jgi:hypothetical protein
VNHEKATERPAGVNKKHHGSIDAASQFQIFKTSISKIYFATICSLPPNPKIEIQLK